METIHLKTIDPTSQELLRAASRRSADLAWERYERLQPQDGFLRLGLSCPFGCLQGPCRIDPFGRGAKEGVCGLGRNEMVAGMLLRLCLHGALEAAADLPETATSAPIELPGKLQVRAGAWLAEDHGGPLTYQDLFRSSLLLHHPPCGYEGIIAQAVRLGLLTTALLEQRADGAETDVLAFQAGYGCLEPDTRRIALSGSLEQRLLDDLAERAVREQAHKIQLISLGDFYLIQDGLAPIVCTSGEAELLASSSSFHLLLAGSGTPPGLIRTCRQCGIEIVNSQDAADGGDVISLVKRCRLQPDRSQFSEQKRFTAALSRTKSGVAQSLRAHPDMPLALIGGMDTVQVSLGSLPVKLATALTTCGTRVISWGDGAVWLARQGLCEQATPPPVLTTGGTRGLLQAVCALAESDRLGRLRGICFTGSGRCTDLAVSLGLSALGCRVCLAVPPPIIGSERVCASLSEMLHRVGGELAYFDHLPDAGEILDWFGMEGSVR